ncbi:MAG: hypothetical protein NOOUEUKL_001996 [Candidatus Fervidibacter sp.]
MGGGGGGIIAGKPQPGPSNSAGWGRGGITNSQWVGQTENFNIGDEPVRLNLRTRPEALTGSQPLLPGPAATEEVIAPPTPSGSSIPLSRLLPTYTQRAEQALSQQTIPPSERQRVRRYFDALRQGTE